MGFSPALTHRACWDRPSNKRKGFFSFLARHEIASPL